jgi:hypothetical protein
MPPLAGLDTVLEPSRLPSRHAGPWAKGCRPPRRARVRRPTLSLSAVMLIPLRGRSIPAVCRWMLSAKDNCKDPSSRQVGAQDDRQLQIRNSGLVGNPGIYLHDPVSSPSVTSRAGRRYVHAPLARISQHGGEGRSRIAGPPFRRLGEKRQSVVRNPVQRFAGRHTHFHGRAFFRPNPRQYALILVSARVIQPYSPACALRRIARRGRLYQSAEFKCGRDCWTYYEKWTSYDFEQCNL